MDPEDSIEVIHSEDTPPSEENIEPKEGNVAPEPIETPTETPVEPVIEKELFELPDGRKVDAETLQSEWKNNFYPEYTRKSQELAALKNSPKEEAPQAKRPYEDPAYVPQSYAEIIDEATKNALKVLKEEQEQKIAQQQAVENAVIEQLNEVKSLDPKVDENKLFLHANKYGFTNLKVAYENMKDMSQLVKNVQQTTAQNIAKRVDPVSVSPTTVGAKPDPSQFATARDYLRSLG